MLIYDGVGKDKRFWPAFGIKSLSMQRYALLSDLQQDNKMYNNRNEASITITIQHFTEYNSYDITATARYSME